MMEGCHWFQGLGEIAQIESDWRALWDRSMAPNPFQHPAWLLPWMRRLADGDLLAFGSWRNGALTAWVPLFLPGSNPGGEWMFAGAGVSDYLGGLWDPIHLDESWAQFWQTLPAVVGAMNWTDLPCGSTEANRTAPGAWIESAGLCQVCPALVLNSRDWRCSVPAARAREVDDYRRRAERTGNLRLESAKAENCLAWFDGLVELHRRRWDSKGMPGVLAGSRLQDFHREAIRALQSATLLRMHALFDGARMIGALYGFRSGCREYFYLSGFDPDWARLSPGTLLIAHAIEQGARDGAIAFDFLRGDEPYKYKWGAQDQQTFSRRFRRGINAAGNRR